MCGLTVASSDKSAKSIGCVARWTSGFNKFGNCIDRFNHNTSHPVFADGQPTLKSTYNMWLPLHCLPTLQGCKLHFCIIMAFYKFKDYLNHIYKKKYINNSKTIWYFNGTYWYCPARWWINSITVILGTLSTICLMCDLKTMPSLVIL